MKKPTPSIVARDFCANNAYMPYGHSLLHILEVLSPVSNVDEMEEE